MTLLLITNYFGYYLWGVEDNYDNKCKSADLQKIRFTCIVNKQMGRITQHSFKKETNQLKPMHKQRNTVHNNNFITSKATYSLLLLKCQPLLGTSKGVRGKESTGSAAGGAHMLMTSPGNSWHWVTGSWKKVQPCSTVYCHKKSV